MIGHVSLLLNNLLHTTASILLYKLIFYYMLLHSLLHFTGVVKATQKANSPLGENSTCESIPLLYKISLPLG